MAELENMPACSFSQHDLQPKDSMQSLKPHKGAVENANWQAYAQLTFLYCSGVPAQRIASPEMRPSAEGLPRSDRPVGMSVDDYLECQRRRTTLSCVRLTAKDN